MAIVSGTFRSLRSYNYRVWAIGAFVSNIGTWIQRTAQDWLVLTQLTDHSAAAVGIVMALQFGPQLLLLPWSGFAADHFDRRKLVMTTQTILGLLALVLGLLTVTGRVELWHVYVLAFALGCTTAFDVPARQTFVPELVSESDLSNAVALDSTSFNAARLIGPTVAGFLIGSVGTGWAFLLNAASFAAVLGSLALLRLDDLRHYVRAARKPGGLGEGFRYVTGRADLRAVCIMLFLVGAFCMNFPIFISTMSVTVFHASAEQFGLLSSTIAVGTVIGALLAATRERPHVGILFISSAAIGLALGAAAMAPNPWYFGAALAVVGVAVLTFTTSTNTTMQLATDPALRGRVIAIRIAILDGSVPLGALIVGFVADVAGPRWGLAVGALAGAAAAAAAGLFLVRHRGLRVSYVARRIRIDFDNPASGT
ncbi:Predicted arabinose efflux permease, MFS family [Phyllobacterium sp. YR620]|uniref:MFS transporter n=1 Tax=Phyllobacterium sp. YR620 TaxID=1881066 RepID=UPI000888E82C|nr:MFS transporter [Phyllobacterium sp. YR620]SDO88587.1 Predicted arabinose efflux permease, MFS family [Phyllobacterium sp. YR620]